MSEPSPDPSWPARPSDLLPYDSNREKCRAFGDPAAGIPLDGTSISPQPGHAHRFNFAPNAAWEEQNLRNVTVPQLASRSLDDRQRFHKLGVDQLLALWAEWESAGLLELVVSQNGFYVPRFIKNDEPGHFRRTLSNHAFGTAFDVNARTNARKKTPALLGQAGSVRMLVEIANKHGFYWGGHFARDIIDGMHFELGKRFNAAVPVGAGEHQLSRTQTIGGVANETGVLASTILAHDDNREFCEARSANTLLEGDRLVVPPVRVESRDLGATQANRFEFGESSVVAMVLQHRGQPLANKRVMLVDGDLVSEATTDPKGAVVLAVQGGATRATVEVETDEGNVLSFDVSVGSLPPIDTVEGISARLRNLGYAVSDSNLAALSQFRPESETSDEGVVIDRETLEALRAASEMNEDSDV
jgi:hypothetical protein